jgi:hypothetical protein
MKIVSFGDSFVWGSELQNNETGNQAWPGLIAQALGAEYTTLSNPGCGNDEIARQILTYFSSNSADNTLAVINWTWGFRWDFYLANSQAWITLGPTCIPSRLDRYLEPADAEKLIDTYSNYVGNSILWNRWRTLQTIYSAQSYLKSIGVTSIQTYMDYELFDTQFHAPDYITALQDLVKKDMQLFQGQNFLDWSRSRGFSVTDPGWHPLEDAHAAARDLWIAEYKQAFNNGYKDIYDV